MEIWKKIPGFDKYECSSLGRIKSNRKILSLRNHIMGYRSITLWRDRKPYQFLVHRLIGITFLENPMGLPQINHINLDRSDNRVENIEWISARRNVLHRGIAKKRIL